MAEVKRFPVEEIDYDFPDFEERGLVHHKSSDYVLIGPQDLSKVQHAPQIDKKPQTVRPRSPKTEKKPEYNPNHPLNGELGFDNVRTDPFYKYSKHIEGELLNAFDTLEFDKKSKSFLLTCKLNNPRKDKSDLLREITMFAQETFEIAYSKRDSFMEAKNTCVMCHKLTGFIVDCLSYCCLHNWPVSCPSADTLQKMKVLLSEEYFLNPKVVSLGDLIDDWDLKKLSDLPVVSQGTHLCCLLVQLLVLEAYLLSSQSPPRKSQAQSCLLQALRLKRLHFHCLFDVFVTLQLAHNFLSVWADTGDEALSLRKHVMIMAERLSVCDDLGHGTTFELSDMWFRGFVKVGGYAHEDLLNKLLGELEDKQVEGYIQRYTLHQETLREKLIKERALSKRKTAARDEAPLPEVVVPSRGEVRHKLGTTALSEQLRVRIRVFLLELYGELKECLHQRGLFKESYLAANYFNNLRVELEGSEKVETYMANIENKISAKNSLKEQEAVAVFKKKQKQDTRDLKLKGWKDDTSWKKQGKKTPSQRLQKNNPKLSIGDTEVAQFQSYALKH